MSIFTKILKKEIPSIMIYEDEICFAILDINPANKGHTLVISNDEYECILDCPQHILSHMIAIAQKVAQKQKAVLSCDGINVMINNEHPAGQEIPHIHIHVIPRFKTDGYKSGFGHVKYQEGEIKELGNKLRIN